jgi:hypothetical protein
VDGFPGIKQLALGTAHQMLITQAIRQWWAVPRLLTLMEFFRFLVHLYVSFYFSLKAYIKQSFSHRNRPHIWHEQNPENGTESTA